MDGRPAGAAEFREGTLRYQEHTDYGDECGQTGASDVPQVARLFRSRGRLRLTGRVLLVLTGAPDFYSGRSLLKGIKV